MLTFGHNLLDLHGGHITKFYLIYGKGFRVSADSALVRIHFGALAVLCKQHARDGSHIMNRV